MFNKNDVCAVIVLYNGEDETVENISKVFDQVGYVVVVDNASKNDIIDKVKELSFFDKITLIENSENMGIAYALNQGLNYATENNYELFLSMDQDSTLLSNAVDIMIDAINDNKFVSVGPNYNNKNYDVKFVEKNFLISSGNLTLTSVANEVEGFDNDFFIDGVDIDFSLKIRKLGHLCMIITEARMEHKLGEEYTSKKLFFTKRLNLHSPFRMYYIFRNNFILRKRYRKYFNNFCKKLKLAIIIKKFEIYNYYPKEARKEYKLQIKKGILDAKDYLNKAKKGEAQNE